MSRKFVQSAAVILLALEALGLLILAGWQIVSLTRGDLASVATSLALIVMSLAAAAGIAAFSYGVAADRSWGRSGGVVTQVLIFAVAVGSVQTGDAHWGVASALAIPAVVTLVAILASARASNTRSSDR